ncbi:unnamed protein product [Brassica oleracea var. botrytis]
MVVVGGGGYSSGRDGGGYSGRSDGYRSGGGGGYVGCGVRREGSYSGGTHSLHITKHISAICT